MPFDLCDCPALAYNGGMDYESDTGEVQTARARFPTSGISLLALREVLQAVKKLVIDKAALRCGDLITLRQVASLFVFGFMLVITIAIAWPERVVANALANMNRARRNIHYPPQTQTVP